jgi:2-polyprenyl-3-methyl-5-hydroxy-6-metoxy-1,4-benzoquinol methylase
MKLDQCPVCQSKNIDYIITAEDFLVTREKFQIYSCQKCGLRFTNPRPDDNQLAGYYDSNEYISHSDESSSLVGGLYKIARTFTLKRKRRLIEKLSLKKHLLDVGCGTGHFIDHCQQHGWQTSGIEPNEVARKQAEARTNTLILQDLSEVAGLTYEVITLWHVLEHLPNLEQTMNQLKSLLAPSGVLTIAVPNFEAYEASVFKEYWAAYDVPRHLYHFNRNAMEHLTSKIGLKIVRTYPMKLDSYYISLLSNKNKSNSNKYVNSFITGLLSNIYAFNSKNYSSLIYQIEKSEEQ